MAINTQNNGLCHFSYRKNYQTASGYISCEFIAIMRNYNYGGEDHRETIFMHVSK